MPALTIDRHPLGSGILHASADPRPDPPSRPARGLRHPRRRPGAQPRRTARKAIASGGRSSTTATQTCGINLAATLDLVEGMLAKRDTV